MFEKSTRIKNKVPNSLIFIGGLIIGIFLIIGFQVIFPDTFYKDKTNDENINGQFHNLTIKYQELINKMLKIEEKLNETDKQLQEKIVENTSVMKNRDEIQNELNIIFEDYNKLNETYNLLYEEYINCIDDSNNWNIYIESKLDIIVIPKRSTVDFWLKTDALEELIDSPNFNVDQLSILLSLKAREKNWRVGVISTIGNFSDVRDSLLINVIATNEGIVYFDPFTDKTYYYEDYKEIPINKTINIGKYKKVYLTNVKKIIPY
jgi:hypothetical protein